MTGVQPLRAVTVSLLHWFSGASCRMAYCLKLQLDLFIERIGCTGDFRSKYKCSSFPSLWVLLNSETAKQRNSETGIFLYPKFLLAKQQKIHQNFFFQLAKQNIWTSGFCIYSRVFISYKLRITMSITKKSGLPGPGYRRILSLRDSVEMISSFFKYS